MNLSPQKEIIVEALRDLQWHCGREWLNQIKDDRIRISELNRGHMLEKGYKIIGVPCNGTVCGIERCPLYKRRAVKLGATTKSTQPQTQTRAQHLTPTQEKERQEALREFERVGT